MRIHLAGNIALSMPREYIELRAPFVLQTFYEAVNWDERTWADVLTVPKVFLLDSGAFALFRTGVQGNLDEYLSRYIEAINRHSVEHFFELDLDPVIGVEATAKLTERLERETGRQCIPVFHRVRGIDTWRSMCRQYPYVAIGATGLTKESLWVKNDELLRRLIDIAHESGAEVHGLGYTRLSNINKTVVPFDSVDSSSCLSGGRYGTVYKFTGTKLISRNSKGRIKDYKIVNRHNIGEWIKMARYKEEHP